MKKMILITLCGGCTDNHLEDDGKIKGQISSKDIKRMNEEGACNLCGKYIDKDDSRCSLVALTAEV